MGDQALELKYEEFLQDPLPVFSRILVFCGLQLDQRQLDQLVGSIDSSRAYAYRQDPDLTAFAERMQDRLQEAGY